MTRVAIALLVLAAMTGCAQKDAAPHIHTGGDARMGKLAMEQHDCGVCHRIPGIRDARGEVGPALDRYRHRVYVAGRLPNTARSLIRWIQHPTTVKPDTAMPDLDVGESDARDMATYLYSLE